MSDRQAPRHLATMPHFLTSQTLHCAVPRTDGRVASRHLQCLSMSTYQVRRRRKIHIMPNDRTCRRAPAAHGEARVCTTVPTWPTIVPGMDETPRTYSISVRLQRITTEETYLSVPVDEAIMQDEVAADGNHRIDPAKLWAEATRLAEQSADWTTEDRQVIPHPIQQAPPWIANQLREQPSGEPN
jgi:hypothetical protein